MTRQFPLKQVEPKINKNNLYIEKVRNHKKILTNLEEIYKTKWNWQDFFKNDKNIVLEIGTGLGNYFSKNVLDNPEKNFIWMEITYKRIFKTAEKSLGKVKNNDNSQNNLNLENKNKNFVMIKDYWEKIDKIFDKNELYETIIFFPDPWDKNEKTKKRRLIQENFLNNLYKITKKSWKLFFKTDHKEYFDFVLSELKKTDWKINFKTNDYEKEGLYIPNYITEFEQIFRWQNIKINYLEVEK